MTDHAVSVDGARLERQVQLSARIGSLRISVSRVAAVGERELILDEHVSREWLLRFEVQTDRVAAADQLGLICIRAMSSFLSPTASNNLRVHDHENNTTYIINYHCNCKHQVERINKNIPINNVKIV